MRVDLFPYDFEETYELFARTNPHEIPSGLLAGDKLREINALSRRERKMYWWYQRLVDKSYLREVANAR